MQFYGFRFFTAYEAMARHLEHQAEARRALGEPLEWTDSTDDVLEGTMADRTHKRGP